MAVWLGKVWGTCLNDMSCFRPATDVQRKPDSVAPRTKRRLMTCDSFNEPGYEQSSCSRYISRNSCCPSRGFDFFTVAAPHGRAEAEGTSTPLKPRHHRHTKTPLCIYYLHICKYWRVCNINENIQMCLLGFTGSFGGSCQCLWCNYSNVNYVFL